MNKERDAPASEPTGAKVIVYGQAAAMLMDAAELLTIAEGEVVVHALQLLQLFYRTREMGGRFLVQEFAGARAYELAPKTPGAPTPASRLIIVPGAAES